MTTLTLIGKPDCHLCDVASEIIDSVVAELPDAAAERIEIVEASIKDDPALYEPVSYTHLTLPTTPYV